MRAAAVVLGMLLALACGPTTGDAQGTPPSTHPSESAGPGDPPPAGGICTPKTCDQLHANCGTVSDGCGHTMLCGACIAPETCGGDGTPNVCGAPVCTPKTCAELGECGSVPDGCGGLLDCGTCGGATCTPKTCAQLGANCGTIDDGCHHSLQCGVCGGSETCGGGGQPNLCGASAQVHVTISPSTQYLRPGSATTLSAKVTGTPDTSVTWAITGGPAGATIRSDGYFVSAPQAGVYTLVATSHADPTQSATATVRTNPPLLDGGGRVLAHPTVWAIWWGAPSVFARSPDELARLFQNLTGSAFLGNLDQYLHGQTASIHFGGNLFDPTEPPNSQDVAPMQTELCAVLDANHLTPDPSALYFLFYDVAPSGAAAGFHWSATCHGISITFAWAKNQAAEGVAWADPHCGASLQSELFAAIASHELTEAMTDPDPFTGWYDPSLSDEIADQCESIPTYCRPLPDGSSWPLVPAWSNASGGCFPAP